MPRPKGPEPTRPLAVRLPASIIQAIDDFAEALAAENPGLAVSRNEAIRMLLLRGLSDVGADVKASRRR